ncbi:hypothetical protein [Vibrio parahaemolyticus]|nr:hypothetical protein [Vibrio parahaemolyticus]
MQITQSPQFNGKASKRLHVMAKPISTIKTNSHPSLLWVTVIIFFP